MLSIIRKTLIIGMVVVSGTHAASMKSNLLIVSGGSWMVFSPGDRSSFYNKFTTTLYSSDGVLRRVVSVPLDWTVSVRSGEVRERFFPGDFDLYFAHRFGWLEPRIGVEIPLGYAVDSTWKKQPWIGSNNMKIQTGFSISRTEFEEIGLPFGVEAMISIAVTDDNAYYRKGSIGTQLYIKSSYVFSKKCTVGGELAVYGKSATWLYNNSTENGITFLPTLSANYRFSRKIYGGIKTGFGPSYALQHGFTWKSNAVDAGVSLLWFP